LLPRLENQPLTINLGVAFFMVEYFYTYKGPGN
jgi:hypothetical protein